jgi:hypothetical protein
MDWTEIVSAKRKVRVESVKTKISTPFKGKYRLWILKK